MRPESERTIVKVQGNRMEGAIRELLPPLQLRVVLPHRMVRTGVSQEVAMELIMTWRNFVGRPFTGVVCICEMLGV